MNDDRISRYLHHAADGIDLAPADPIGAVRRGTRRRTRRRIGLVGAVAVVGVLATSVAVRSGGDDQQVDMAAAMTASRSTYDWSVVTPQSGLAWANEAVQLADGDVYSISTAPGPYREGDQTMFASTLYRSGDGREWSPVSLPSGIRSADLAAAGDTLYSVGTSPAGGVVLSSTTDGAGTWASRDLPREVADLQARHPNKIVLGQLRMAARDDSHIVVGLTAATTTDLAQYRPEYSGDQYTWQWDDVGVSVYEVPQDPCADTASTLAVEGALEQSSLQDCGAQRPEHGDQVAAFTYDDLGITGELRDHIGGKVYVYATDDGQSFRRVELPAVGVGPADVLYVASPLVVSDGYRLVVPGNDQTTVLRSADGFSWDTAAVLPAASGGPAGVLDGRATVITWDSLGHNLVQIENVDGSWSTIDPVRAVGSDPSTAYVGSVAFGPLGIAAEVSSYVDGRSPKHYLVHSTDGSNLQVLDLTDQVPETGSITGVVVTADAIVVRISDGSDGDPSTPPKQHVLVGTPTS